MATLELTEKIFIPLIAALVGALIGASFASISQKRSIIRNDKKLVLAQLMGCRHDAGLDNDFVKALNMTTLIFHNNVKVKEALHHYLLVTGRQNVNYTNGDRLEAFYKLITEMGIDLGYSDLNRNDLSEYYFPLRPQLPEQENNQIAVEVKKPTE